MLVSNLPDPTNYKDFIPRAPIITYKENKHHLENEIKRFAIEKAPLIVYFELTKIFGEEFIGRLDFLNNPVLKAINTDMVKVQGYKEHYYNEYNYFCTHSSLAILLYDKDELKTAAIRRYRTKSGEVIKWYKVKGSSAKFIPYRLNDKYSYCFVAFGMAEALIFNILGLEYFILQSDGEAYNLPSNPYFKAIKEQLRGRDILILPDYDESGFKAARALKASLKDIAEPRIIEFYKLVNNPKKGFDFRDYVLQIQDKDLIIQNLINLI